MKETTKPEASLFDARVALIVALIAFATCFFVAGEAMAQTVYPAITKEAGEYHNSSVTLLPTGFWAIDTDKVGIGAIRKDTVFVPILCSYGNPKMLDESTKVFLDVVIMTAKQERTLGWKPNALSHQKYVVIETRWLDTTDGCYHLTKIENSEK